MRCLALVTARGGSVRLPRKNVKLFNGRPLIEWTITAALDAGRGITRLVVSTDCKETAALCRALGCDVPFIRPSELATSAATSINVVRHCIDYVEKVDGDHPYDWILLLQPTSPLRTSSDIVAALDIASSKDVTAVISVCEVIESHPQKLKTIKDNFLKPYLGEKIEQVRSQDLYPPLFRTNGAIYLTKREVIMDQKGFYGERPAPLVMPQDRSIDIDTEFDFQFASQILAHRNQG